jgi:hypothetical protein
MKNLNKSYYFSGGDKNHMNEENKAYKTATDSS